jgi:hypothetical protein
MIPPTPRSTDVFVARGLLIESVDASWYYGTAVEHATLYQYQFQEASQIVTTFIQTETPYYQPNPAIPGPFLGTGTVGFFRGDPVTGDCWPSASGAGCDSAWGLRIRRSTSIKIYGAGLYSFFQNFNQGCVQTRTCQLALMSAEYNYENVFIYNLVTVGTTYMLVGSNYVTNQTITAASNQNGPRDPWWSTIGLIQLQQTAHINPAALSLPLSTNSTPGSFGTTSYLAACGAVPGTRITSSSENRCEWRTRWLKMA